MMDDVDMYTKACNTIEEAAVARKELEQLYWNR